MSLIPTHWGHWKVRRATSTTIEVKMIPTRGKPASITLQVNASVQVTDVMDVLTSFAFAHMADAAVMVHGSLALATLEPNLTVHIEQHQKDLADAHK